MATKNDFLTSASQKPNLIADAFEIETREGIPLMKGEVLNSDYVIKHQELIQNYLAYFTAYPDRFLDTIALKDSGFSLFFYQRILLRTLMRYRSVYVVAPRAAAKSFITILAMLLQCVFFPGTKRFICAPFQKQGAQIAKEKIGEIFTHFPLLKREVVGWQLKDPPGNYGVDKVQLTFRNRSIFDVVGAADSTRGGRRNGGLIDEVRDHDQDALESIVMPLMNVARRIPSTGKANDKEPNAQQAVMTSAGSKSSYAYSLLLDFFERSIIDPKSTFVMGFDYKIPLMHDLLDKEYLKKIQTSSSYDEATFFQEYMSLWGGSDKDSWFDYEKLTKYRKLKNPESKAMRTDRPNQFYIISADVGRINDATVATVFRVNVRNGGKFYASVVNIVVLGLDAIGKTFMMQAIDLKELIQRYDPREVIIDTNGLGIGLADEMIKEHYGRDGSVLPAYAFHNDDVYKAIQPPDAEPILYSLKANQTLNSQIAANAFTRIHSGLVQFLIDEREARNYLLSSKVGKKMSTEARIKRLMPHEMTTKLFLEMANLKVKSGSGVNIVLERINARFPKDKYSSFSYGLWRIREMEDVEQRRYQKKAKRAKRQLTFFTEGR